MSKTSKTSKTSNTSKSRIALGAGLVATIAFGGVATFAHAGGAAQASTLVPIAPCRLVDTRRESTRRRSQYATRRSRDGRRPGVGDQRQLHDPLERATGIVTNATSVNGTADSYITVYPGDVALPMSSNLNVVAGGAPTPNQVTVGLSATGAISAFNNGGSVDVIIDIVGYYQAESAGSPGQPGKDGQDGSLPEVVPVGQDGHGLQGCGLGGRSPRTTASTTSSTYRPKLLWR